MSGAFFFAVKSIGLSKQGGRKPSTLASAARHNLREIQAELGVRGHIDSSKTHRNEVLAGARSAQGVVGLAGELMLQAGIDVARLRKDYCQAVELVFSLPPDTTVEAQTFFHRCVQWTGDRFGQGAVLSAVAHYDESSPHAHVLISPIVNGRMRGSELIDRKALACLRKSFEVLVARPFKLTLPPPRLSHGARRLATAAVLEKLQRNNDGVLRSATWSTVKSLIEADPRPFVSALGLEVEPAAEPHKRSYVQIMIGTGRGGKVDRDSRQSVGRIARHTVAVPDSDRAKPILCRLQFDAAGHALAEAVQQ